MTQHSEIYRQWRNQKERMDSLLRAPGAHTNKRLFGEVATLLGISDAYIQHLEDQVAKLKAELGHE